MEWGVVAVIAIAVIFLGAKLPQIARNVGKAQTEFKKGLKEGATEEDTAAPAPAAPPAAAAPAPETPAATEPPAQATEPAEPSDPPATQA
jgi:sec-independent protein translocase protein TatA